LEKLILKVESQLTAMYALKDCEKIKKEFEGKTVLQISISNEYKKYYHAIKNKRKLIHGLYTAVKNISKRQEITDKISSLGIQPPDVHDYSYDEKIKKKYKRKAEHVKSTFEKIFDPE